MELSAGYFTASVVDGRPGNRPFSARCFSRNIEWKRRYEVQMWTDSCLLVRMMWLWVVFHYYTLLLKLLCIASLVFVTPGGVSDSCVENTEQCVRLCVELIHCLAPRKIFSFIECHWPKQGYRLSFLPLLTVRWKCCLCHELLYT